MDQFREIFEECYVPLLYNCHFRHDFLWFKHGERKVEQYTIRFHELLAFALSIAQNNEDIKAMYVEGLWQVMLAQEKCTMAHLHNRVILVERGEIKPKRVEAGGFGDRYKPSNKMHQGGG